MSRANAAYLNNDLKGVGCDFNLWTCATNQKNEAPQAKSLAQEVVQQRPSYPEVWDLLAKINEEQENWADALTAYMSFVTLRYPQKTIQRERIEREHSGGGDGSDSSSDSDAEHRADKRPTAQLIQKIAALAIRTENDEMALQMLARIEAHTKHLVAQLQDTRSCQKLRWSEAQVSAKRRELDAYLLSLFRQRAALYARLKRTEPLKAEYRLIYGLAHRHTHPLLHSDAGEVQDLELDENHKECLEILRLVAADKDRHARYRQLRNYFVIVELRNVFAHDFELKCHHAQFRTENKFKVDGAAYLRWLQCAVRRNQEYRQLFYRLLTLFVSAAMEMCHFGAALRFLRLFLHLYLFPFSLLVRSGVCCLWLRRREEAEWLPHYSRLVAAPQQTGFGGLYMLFADALIARHELDRAQVLMSRIERIAAFDTPRIWLRFADCLALQKRYELAMQRYAKVIAAVQGEEDADKEEVLFSARLKLTELHFVRNDEASALRLLREMKTMAPYKAAQPMDAEALQLSAQEDSDGDDDDEDDDEDKGATRSPQKRVRLSPTLRSYFSAGLFGAVLVPKQLLRLEVLHVELRAGYARSVKLLYIPPFIFACSDPPCHPSSWTAFL